MNGNGRHNGAAEVLATARRYIDAGLSIIPVKVDGTKKPLIAWKEFESRQLSAGELDRYFGHRLSGIATVCWKISGNMELIDIDDGSLIEPFETAVNEACPGLIERLCTDQTPRDGGGRQYKYRCLEVAIPGNDKLALSELEPAFNEDGSPQLDPRTNEQKVAPRTLIETRGEGGYAIAPGSPLTVHKSGRPYVHVRGPDLTTLPIISAAERAVLFRVGRSFNCFVAEYAPQAGERPLNGRIGLAPGADFNQRANWSEILAPHGWKQSGTRGGLMHWTRPGKSAADGDSATTGVQSKGGNDLLCVFSTNAYPFEGASNGRPCTSYSKFAAYSVLNHNSDYSAAAKALAGQGYGDKQTRKARGGKAQPRDDGLSNATFEKIDEETVTVPVPMVGVLAKIRSLTADWPRRVDQALFVHVGEAVSWLNSAAATFGWLASVTGPVTWYRGSGCVSKEETFCELCRIATGYRAVEELPHEPPLEGHYYACKSIEPGDGTTLNTLLDCFNPATPIDRDLIQAALMTPLWGATGGLRPCFVVTSDDGRGTGKSKIPQMIGHLFGGFLDFSHNEPITAIKTRLLSADALTKRVALLDNVKSLNFSWGELEGLVTSPEISGHRMYHGDARRPNTITWFITLNGACLSTDMAQRSVIIKVAMPKRTGDWEEETLRFVIDNRRAVLADLIAALRARPWPLTRFSRWATWEKHVLSRLPEPSDAQQIILERQAAVDVEGEEVEVIEEFFAGQLRRLGYDVDREKIHVPSEFAARWFNRSMNADKNPVSAGRVLSQMHAEGRLKRIAPDPERTHGRGFLWSGKAVDYTTTKSIDLRERVAERRAKSNKNEGGDQAFW